MESIEEVINEAIRLLENKDISRCKKHLEKAKENFKKANTDEELKYLKSLENSLK
jgi:cellobiose-specific phosphotransferase system component IIA